MKDQPYLDTSPEVSDEIRKTTCYMCACRCGINVHVKNNKVSYIEGNKDHPVNKGVLCAKGSAGIMQINAPSRLKSPLKRVGPRGSGEFEEITWEEALNLATTWLKPIREKIQKSWHFLLVGINLNPLHLFGHKTLARLIMRRMVVFARLIWLQQASIQWVARFGSLDNQTGSIQSFLCCLGSQRTMIATR